MDRQFSAPDLWVEYKMLFLSNKPDYITQKSDEIIMILLHIGSLIAAAR